MRKNKTTNAITAIMLAFLITITGVLFAGCGQSKTESGDQNSLEPGETRATVTAVDGNRLTLEIGGGTRNGMRGGPGGQTPPDCSGDANGEAPAMPDGQTPPDFGGGENGGRGPGEKGSSSATVTVSDESVICNSDGSGASFADIAVGSVITVTVGDNGSVTKIVIDRAAGASGSGIEGGI